MKKIFTLIFALLAIFTNVKAEEIVLWEGSEKLGWGGVVVNTSKITATSDIILNITTAHDGKWCQYCVCSTNGEWKKLQLISGSEFVTANQMTGFTWGSAGTCTDSFELTPELISAIKAGGSMAFQGGGGDDGGTITLKKVTVTTKTNYQTEARNIPFDEWGNMLASDFNGLSDAAKVEFTYNLAGDVDSYKGWGFGQLLSIDQSVNLNQSFAAGVAGDNVTTLTVADLKAALSAGPDKYDRYGLYWNMWGQGDGKVTAKRVSVKAYEVVGYMSDGYKDPTYKADVEERAFTICDGNVIALKDFLFYNQEYKVKLVIEDAAGTSAYKEIGALANLDGSVPYKKLYGAEGTTYNIYVTVADLIAAEKASASSKGMNKAAASSGAKVVLAEGLTLKSVYLQKPLETGIENIAAQPEAESGATYNIAGQRVGSNAKGLVIRNGKKFFVK